MQASNIKQTKTFQYPKFCVKAVFQLLLSKFVILIITQASVKLLPSFMKSLVLQSKCIHYWTITHHDSPSAAHIP